MKPLAAQTLPIGKYGVSYVDDPVVLVEMGRKEPEKKLIELKKLIPSLVYDFRYADVHNFTGKRLYPEGTATTFLRKPAADALLKVQKALKKRKRGLKVFDAYRPYDVSVAFWELIGDERYVANPSKGSGHNRGLAIDLTLIDLTSGKELDMGTGFDHFSDTAHHSFKELPPDVLLNRRLLRKQMTRAGFEPLETEWWHYAWPNDKNYEVLNVWFDKVKSW